MYGVVGEGADLAVLFGAASGAGELSGEAPLLEGEDPPGPLLLQEDQPVAALHRLHLADGAHRVGGCEGDDPPSGGDLLQRGPLSPRHVGLEHEIGRAHV